MNKWLFTSESVTEGHPDKICDQISDAILDELLKQDPNSRVACETTVTTGLVLVVGEISTNGYVDIQTIVRDTIREIGYTHSSHGFDADTCGVIVSLSEQSSDIAQGVDSAQEFKGDKRDKIGAGDQGMMFGYATNETEEYMPLPIQLAHKLTKQLTKVRKDGILDYLRPDGKSQVTVEYQGNKPVRIDTILISAQHSEDVELEQIKADLMEYVVREIIPEDMIDEDTKYYFNPTGRFVIGGPMGDAGLTGRKIIVDTYGGMGRHGGGAFSGKDPTKVDRSAAYAARHVAKNIVAAGLCDNCEVALSYGIGIAKPLSVNINTFGTEKIAKEEIIERVNKVFDLRPAAIIEDMDLQRPIYKDIAAYGHFGRDDLDLPWERLDKVDELKSK